MVEMLSCEYVAFEIAFGIKGFAEELGLFGSVF